MRLIVCGGRDYPHWQKVWSALDAIHRRSPITLVIHGDASGADAHAADWAAARQVPVHPEPANWLAHGKAAGPIRNAKMLTLSPDGVLALPGGRGTLDMTRQAKAAGVTVWRPYG